LLNPLSSLFTSLNRRQRRGICVTLTIKGYDKKGRLTGIRKRKSDLILDNFGKWLATLIQDASAVRTVTLKSEAGVDENLYSYGTTNHFNSYGTGMGAFIVIGSGTGTPARDQYCLVTKEGENGVSPATYLNGMITFAANITLGSEKTIKESGLLMKWRRNTGEIRSFLLFRDTFAGVTGTIFTVEYRMNL